MRIKDIEVRGAEGSLAARLYVADDSAPVCDLLVVYFHGGGFADNRLDQADRFPSALAAHNAGCVVLASDYRSAATAPFPAALEDAYSVLSWARTHSTTLCWSGRKLAVAGIEAGANLAAGACFMARDRRTPAVSAQLLIMPMLDPSLSTGSMREMTECTSRESVANCCALAYSRYLANPTDRQHPYAAPLHATRLKNLPPALLVSVDNDPLRDEAEQYGIKLIAAGVRTTALRLDAVPLSDSGWREKLACQPETLSEVAAFLACLKG